MVFLFCFFLLVLVEHAQNMTYILDGVSVSQLAIRRLEKINNTVIRLRPLVDSYAGFDPNTTALQPLIDDIDQLFDFSEQVRLIRTRLIMVRHIMERHIMLRYIIVRHIIGASYKDASYYVTSYYGASY